MCCILMVSTFPILADLIQKPASQHIRLSGSKQDTHCRIKHLLQATDCWMSHHTDGGGFKVSPVCRQLRHAGCGSPHPNTQTDTNVHLRPNTTSSGTFLLPKQGSGVSTFVVSKTLRKRQSERDRKRKGVKRCVLISLGCETPSFIHSLFYCQSLLSVPMSSAWRVCAADTWCPLKAPFSNTSTTLFFLTHKPLSLFSMSVSHHSAILTQIQGSNHKTIL